MKTTISKHLNLQFELDECRLENISNFLHERLGSVNLKAECNDDATREFESFEILKKFDNTDTCKIVDLTVSSAAPGIDDLYVSIQFHTESNSPELFSYSFIHLYISGQDEVVRNLYSELKDKIEMLRPWYSKYSTIQKNRLDTVFILIVAFITVVTQYYIGIKDYLGIGIANSPIQYFILFLYAIGVALVSIVVYILLSPLINLLTLWLITLRKKIFPAGVFLLGHQLIVEKNLDKKRRALVSWFWGSLACTVLSLIVYLGGQILRVLPS